MVSNWSSSGRKWRHSGRKGGGRPFKPIVPTTRLVVHSTALLNKDDVVGCEIRPKDISRYKMRKVMLTCTVRMPPGELLNYLVVKCSSPLVNWGAAFSSPALLVKEDCQDMITILGKGKIESSGVAGSDCTKSFSRFVKLGSGVTQTQHLYVILYTSVSMKSVLEHRMYVEV
ncbi:capsid protein [Cow vetch latent virus]|uniref:Capsid protein n=1 Tax=Cow vetch latent virus TaxID=2056780 RepID=A0A2H4T2E2_9VIRU|nr:capsid protein [Cow vetch latent virus]ATY70083.1 capsid protein [Cow vetch latent virus]